jgi:hypothetical protein
MSVDMYMNVNNLHCIISNCAALNENYVKCLITFFFCLPYIFLPAIHYNVSTNSQNTYHYNTLTFLYASSFYLCVGLFSVPVLCEQTLWCNGSKTNNDGKKSISSLYNNNFWYFSRTSKL